MSKRKRTGEAAPGVNGTPIKPGGRVVLAGQANPSQNGIWIYDGPKKPLRVPRKTRTSQK